MATFSFYCRESKAGKKGTAPIEMSIVINGKRLFVNLPRQEKPKDFKKAMAETRDNDIKRFCAVMERNAKAAMTDMADSGVSLTADDLRQFLKYGGNKPYTIGDLFNDFLKAISLRVNNSLSPRAFHRYELLRDMFTSYIDCGLSVRSITENVVVGFYESLKAKYEPATSGGIMTRLKSVVKYGIEKGNIRVNPFAMVRIYKGEPKKEFLDENELNTILNKDFGIDRLNKIRDLFLFQVCSGLSYSDMAEIRQSDVLYRDGVYFISKERNKTGVPFCAVILPLGIEIFNRYHGCLPIVSNQKLNAYLKEIEVICGINKTLHTHLARKTYATYMNKKGYRLSTISRMLGHKNTHITESTYVMFDDSAVIEEAQIISARM